MVDQALGVVGAERVLVLAVAGDEGLSEGALGEHAAQQVGQLEGDEEGVGQCAGAENTRDDEVAHEAKDAREQRHATDGGEGLEQIHPVFRAEARAPS